MNFSPRQYISRRYAAARRFFLRFVLPVIVSFCMQSVAMPVRCVAAFYMPGHGGGGHAGGIRGGGGGHAWGGGGGHGGGGHLPRERWHRNPTGYNYQHFGDRGLFRGGFRGFLGTMATVCSVIGSVATAATITAWVAALDAALVTGGAYAFSIAGIVLGICAFRSGGDKAVLIGFLNLVGLYLGFVTWQATLGNWTPLVDLLANIAEGLAGG